MEKKLRIQLFTEDGAMVSDRLVAQSPELAKGPKEKHEGPIRVEFTLTEGSDTEGVIKYLQELTGILPITTKEKKAKKTDLDDVSNEEMETFIEELMSQDDITVANLIKWLRKDGFILSISDYLLEIAEMKLNIKNIHLEKYQWFIRRLKDGANPATDKYDPRMLFGIKYIPELGEKVIVYLEGEYYKSFTLKVGDGTKEVMKTTSEAALKFPHYLNEDERAKFRYDLRKMVLDPEKLPTKFISRWAEYVENIPEELLKRINN